MAPRRMTDGSEDIRRALGIRYHASTIRKQTLTRQARSCVTSPEPPGSR
jgi:hypothetical protein